MKFVMFVIDGASDVPAPELGSRTPLEAAFAPTLHHLAARGVLGRLESTFEHYPVESMVCVMGLIGYEPAEFYPGGRSAFEAMALGIPLNDDDLIFRCNTITVDPSDQRLTDFTAGMISDSTARRVLSRLQLPDPSWEVFPGQSYRNVLVIRHSGIRPTDIVCAAPHMHIGESAHDLLPYGLTEEAEALAARIRTFLLDTHRQMSPGQPAHNGHTNMLWVWSGAKKASWPSFESRTRKTAALVGGLNFLHGIAMAADIDFDRIPGATGYLDTNYEAKLTYAIDCVRNHDFTLVHINAADEAGHKRDAVLKTRVIEEIDQRLLGPLVRSLREQYGDDGFRLMICPDHATRSDDGRHTREPVPFVLYGHGVEESGVSCFSEAAASELPLQPPLSAISLLFGNQ